MSAAQSSAPAAAASARAPFKKRPRHFWEGPDPTDEPDEEKQGAAHVSPVARLYRHALESVFGFLELAELSRALSVSHPWSAAVRSMKSIGAWIDTSSLRSPPPAHIIAASSLAPHISKLSLDVASSSDLLLLSRLFGSLTSLSCSVELSPSARVYFGATLQFLLVQFKDNNDPDTTIINDAIVVISRLPRLDNLTLMIPALSPTLNLAPLAAAAQLQILTLFPRHMSSTPALPQLDQLRMLPHLRKLNFPGVGWAGLLYLLRTPHSLQWQEIHTVAQIDDATSAALSALPSLTTLSAGHCLSVAFLPCLTRLRSLHLRINSPALLAADLTASLPCCSQLTELVLDARDVTSKHLSQALSQLSMLRALKLECCLALESLSFLSECTQLAQSLQSLDLTNCRNAALHSTELRHVLTLKSLTVLSLFSSFVEPLDACTRHLLQPPSLVLPALTHFLYCN